MPECKIGSNNPRKSEVYKEIYIKLSLPGARFLGKNKIQQVRDDISFASPQTAQYNPHINAIMPRSSQRIKLAKLVEVNGAPRLRTHGRTHALNEGDEGSVFHILR
jgi:hypothetical protein